MYESIIEASQDTFCDTLLSGLRSAGWEIRGPVKHKPSLLLSGNLMRTRRDILHERSRTGLTDRQAESTLWLQLQVANPEFWTYS